MATIDISQVNNIYTPQPVRQIGGHSHSLLKTNKPPLDRIFKVSPTGTARLKNRISVISKLRDNWDGYGAIRPNKETISQSNIFLSGLSVSVLQYLNEEDISPTPYGTIIMDFYRESNRLSIEFGESKIGFFSELINNQNTESDGVKFDRTKLPNELQTAIELFLQA